MPNIACTIQGGYCSVSDTCSSLGGHVEKLSARCKCGNPCCKCTDTCPEGSMCMSEGDICDGTKEPNGCCGNRFCCTLPVTTTPAPCEPNVACTGLGGNCSDSDTCSSSGGQVEKLSTGCKCGKACCKCTDICPEGSICMGEGDTCDGTKDTNGCCGNRFCCTPPMTTTPVPCVETCKGTCETEDCGVHIGQPEDGDCCGSKKCCFLG
ncbi:keratin-associated protein 5-8-like [Mytilus trossulus]|uniref:keratin-associated protein 5-8-like n=1 Tax=Mytilus trossulus TaxID=6551 RepID=UPI003004AD5B